MSDSSFDDITEMTDDTFSVLADHGVQQVLHCTDARSGLRAIIAIHSTELGPALGGARFRPYATDRDALVDACRLARGMTFKHALAGLDQGGGKAVILGDPTTERSEPLLRAFGRFVDGLAGQYITAEDVGTTCADMDLIRQETRHVAGVSEALGGSGDPSPATALGVLWAMRAAARHLWAGDLSGRHVVISGVGKVGSALARLLAAEGTLLTIADIDGRRASELAAELGASVVDPVDAHTLDCDIFAPCALGGVLDAERIPQLRCAAVVGSANNQLASKEDAARLAARGVLYVPDFVANAGGVINIAEEITGYDHTRADRRVAQIYDTVLAVLAEAERIGATSDDAAEAIALRRIEDHSKRPNPAQASSAPNAPHH